MPKFYVQSGQYCLIVQAHDGEGATLWAIHQYLATCGGEFEASAIGTEQSAQPTLSARRTHSGRTAILPDADVPRLSATIRCSEIGFGRADQGEFFTTDVLQKYCELLSALAAL